MIKRVIFLSLFILFHVAAYNQNTFPATGNVGIGTSSPGASLSFEDVWASPNSIGITWLNAGPTAYGLYKTAGSWTAPNYQQIALSWETGIILNPGTLYGKSYVDVSGNGLRVSSGNAVIGSVTDDGTNKLQVNGTIKASGLMIPTGAAAGKVLTSNADGVASWQAATGGAGSWTVSGANLSNANTGIVVIGGSTAPVATPADAAMKLAVKGNIYAQKLKITQTGWADYVFDPAYQLRSLQEVKNFIQKNQRLPELPSAAEVIKNGIDIGDNQVILLKKIEELTLYVIKDHEEIERLKKINAALQHSNQPKKKPGQNR